LPIDNYKNYNNGYSILLNIIEGTSKYLYSYPLKSKKDVYSAFKDLIEEKKVKIANLTTDAGSEFISKKLKELLKKHSIHFFNTKKKSFVSPVERVNKTMRELIERYLTGIEQFEGKRYRWIDVYPELVANYNNSYHSSIKTTPALMSTESAFIDRVKHRLQKRASSIQLENEIERKFKPGGFVRIREKKDKFEKSAVGNWSNKLYKIESYERPITVHITEVDGGKKSEVPYYNLLPVLHPSKQPALQLAHQHEARTISSRKKIRRERATVQKEKREDIKKSNILPEEKKRVRRPNVTLKSFALY
jgi:hypothetical protein